MNPDFPTHDVGTFSRLLKPVNRTNWITLTQGLIDEANRLDAGNGDEPDPQLFG